MSDLRVDFVEFAMPPLATSNKRLTQQLGQLNWLKHDSQLSKGCL